MLADQQKAALFREIRVIAKRGLTQAEVDTIEAIIATTAPPAGEGLGTGADAAAGAGGDPEAVQGLSEPPKFFAGIRDMFGTLKQGQIDGINAILAALAGWPVSWTAYGLATAKLETASTMQPIKEYGGAGYFTRMYDIQGDRPAKARELGNLAPGDGAKYAGRGYVQLTGKHNYVRAGQKIGVALSVNPDLAMGPTNAARIMREGMEAGWFTGKRLADFLPAVGNTDGTLDQFKQARRIINGLDRAVEIARMAEKFQAALRAGDWRG